MRALSLLERHLRYLDEKEQDFVTLRYDAELEALGWRTYYLADFSELHSYLHFDRDFAAHEGRYASAEDREVARTELRLAISHLFLSCGERTYLMEPHARELWNHFVFLAVDPHRVRELNERARKALSSLDQQEQTALRSLMAQHELSREDRHRLTQLVEGSFAKLCADMTDISVALETLGSATRNLRTIEQRVTLSIRPICIAHHVSPEEALNVGAAELELVFARFSGRGPFASYRDAHAILILRNLNRILEPRRARAILVTRDSLIWATMQSLAEDSRFGWPSAIDYLRQPEFMFLHLLASATSANDSLAWITEAGETVRHLKTLAASLQATKRHGARKTFAKNARLLFANAKSHWSRHVNVRLAHGADSIEWLKFPCEEPEDSSAPQRARLADSTGDVLEQLLALSRFVVSESNREQMLIDGGIVWSSFLSEGLWARFLELLSDTDAAEVRDLICERYDTEGDAPKIVLRTASPGMISSLQFQSEWYATAFAGLMRANEKRGQHRADAKTLILKAGARILGDQPTDRPEPEGLLFIGLVLTTLGRWALADRCTARALELPGDINRHEAAYTRAVCNRMMALVGRGRYDHYLTIAFEHVQQARLQRARERQLEVRENPRYLKELAIVIMLYWARNVPANQTSSAATVPRMHLTLDETSLPMAKAAIDAALELVIDDVRLQAELLNATVYFQSLPSILDIANARVQLHALEELLSTRSAVDDPTIPKLEDPAYRFTKEFLAASERRALGDDEGFQMAIERLQELSRLSELTETERAFFCDGIELLKAPSVATHSVM